jgi:LuxR family maltose regulon positive regulatory protein
MALEHLLQTTERGRAAILLTELSLPNYYAGQLSTSMRWRSILGDVNIERYPPLAVLAGWGAVLTGDTIGAERWAAFMEGASFDLVPADGSASFESARAILRAAMCARGPERMMADAELAVAQEPAWSPWRATALWLLGEAHLLAGMLDTARTLFSESSRIGAALGGTGNLVLSQSELALTAMDRGEWKEAADHLEWALATIDKKRMQDYVGSLLAFAAAARLALHRGRMEETEAELARAMRGRPSATYVLPFIAVHLRAELAKIYLAMANPAAAGHLVREVDEVLLHRPALGVLAAQVQRLRRSIASSSQGVAGAPPLSAAELRLLPYLQTHLTLGAIAERLFISRPTVSSEVASIFRKLGVSSRRDAVEQATAVGLLGV